MAYSCLPSMNSKAFLLCIMIASTGAFSRRLGKEIGEKFFLQRMSSAEMVSVSSATEQMRKDAQSEMEKVAKHYELVLDKLPTSKIPSMWNTKEEASSFVDKNIDAVLFDCDGVVYRSPVPGKTKVGRACLATTLFNTHVLITFSTGRKTMYTIST